MALAAAVCFLAFAVLGTTVTRRLPLRLDVAASELFGRGTPLAAFFTLLGRWYVLAGVAIATTLVTLLLHGDLRAVIALYVTQLLGQAAVAGIKLVYRRSRPQRWLVVHEPDWSYPSGHAATSIVFYCGLALLVTRSSVVPPAAVAPLVMLAVVCAIGIPWSRLALGAHYLSDVAGGLLFGCGWLCGALAIAQRVAISSRIRL